MFRERLGKMTSLISGDEIQNYIPRMLIKKEAYTWSWSISSLLLGNCRPLYEVDIHRACCERGHYFYRRLILSRRFGLKQTLSHFFFKQKNGTQNDDDFLKKDEYNYRLSYLSSWMFHWLGDQTAKKKKKNRTQLCVNFFDFFYHSTNSENTHVTYQ